ncbi:MAG: hypothetical protein CL768_05955 [Chloroflexi bacterium]|nr:hypothetical protein [Chloroflexota bacterium]
MLPNPKANYCWNCGNEFHGKTSFESEEQYSLIDYIFRIIRILRLDETVYSEIKSDKSKKAYVVAFSVLILSASATILGFSIPTAELPYHVLYRIVAWFTWFFLIFILGIIVFRNRKSNPNWFDLVRIGGMASSPKIFQVIGTLPVISYEVYFGLFLIITGWQVLAMTQGVKIIFNRDKASLTEFLLVLLTLTPWIVIERFL